MGYQALLFCPDEKLARVVSQVFSELDFAIDPVHEPFAAVKKLMAQRYDAIVVDCENEQNASLLFKSARNSSVNQSSLAIALVEGQAGVAKAYRIGANLVLTKPINVEQAKGTLRVARGLLRKNSDAAASATSGTPAAAAPKTALASAGGSTRPVNQADALTAGARPSNFSEPAAAAETARSAPELPTIAASAQADEKPASTATPAVRPDMIIAAEAAEAHQAEFPPADATVKDNSGKNEATKAVVGAVVAQDTGFATPSFPGSAAAAAPARETTGSYAKEPGKDKDSKVIGLDTPGSSRRAAPEPAAAASALSSFGGPAFGSSDAPSFSALSEEDSEGSNRTKRILIPVAVLVLAIVGYLSYGRLGKSAAGTAPQPASAPQNSTQPAPAVAPMSTPEAAPTPTIDRASTSEAPASTGKASTTLSVKPSNSGRSPVIRIAANSAEDSEPETKKSSPPPIVVKPGRAEVKPRAPIEESAPPPANAVASTSSTDLSAVIPSASSVPKPSLATVRISQGVSQGLVIKRVQPIYPASALAVHAQGAVQIEATVSKQGNVTNLKVISGDPILARAALDAVRQWRYKPYYLDGAPVEIQTEITVNFKSN